MSSGNKRHFVSLKCIHLLQLSDLSSPHSTTSTPVSAKSQPFFAEQGSKVDTFSVLLLKKCELFFCSGLHGVVT